jgi:hypothetical protein
MWLSSEVARDAAFTVQVKGFARHFECTYAIIIVHRWTSIPGRVSPARSLFVDERSGAMAQHPERKRLLIIYFERY